MVSPAKDGIGLRPWVIYVASAVLALLVLVLMVFVTGSVPHFDPRVLI